MGKRSVVSMLVVCMAATMVASAPAWSSSSAESCFLRSINAERTKVGRARLSLKADLVSVARQHSRRMANDETIYHNGNLRNEVDGGWWALGENVGMGPSCESLHGAFMDSSGHRANILDKSYNQAGIGVTVRDGTIYVTEVFAGRRTRSSSVRRDPPARRVTRVVPKPKPRPPARRPTAEPRTLAVLLVLVGLDAERVDPANGAALGV